jgi:hypothetical protein
MVMTTVFHGGKAGPAGVMGAVGQVESAVPLRVFGS